MRHVIGIVGAIGLAAAVFFAAGWGYWNLLRVPVVNGGASTLPVQGGSLLHASNVLEAVGALAGTALLAGIFIAVRQISPLAAGLPGLVLIAWTVFYGWSVRRGVHYIPLHLQPYWRDRYSLKASDFPVSQKAYERMLSIPLYSKMTDADVERVIAALHAVFADA